MDPVILAALMVGLPLWSGLIAWPAGVRKIETTSRRQRDRAQNESNPQAAE